MKRVFLQTSMLFLLVITAPLAFAQTSPWVSASLKQMTLREKAAHVLFPAVPPSILPEGGDALREFDRALASGIGGFHCFRGDAEQVRAFTDRAQGKSRVPVLVTADFEGGAAWIVRGTTRFVRGMGLAASGRPDLACAVGAATAREGRALGIHVNFYPVLDVSNNPDNPIINIRSFGDLPEDVARFGRAYIDGCQIGGMLATAKHFPGHGDTATDSHLDLPVVHGDRARLDAIELPPFRAAVDEGVAAIMSAHIAWPGVTGDASLPATLSPLVLTDLLRGEMGFRGIVFTDAMVMKGITKQFTPAEATVRALAAGADVILFAEKVDELIDAIVDAVAKGRLSEARLDRSVERLLAAKERLALHRSATPRIPLAEALGRPETLELRARVANASMTLLRDRDGRLPLSLDKDHTVLHVVFRDPGQDWVWDSPGDAMKRCLLQRGAKITTIYLGGGAAKDLTSAEMLELKAALAQSNDAIIASVHVGLAAYRGESGVSAAQVTVLNDLAKRGAILVGLGNPYGLREVQGFGTVLLGYDVEESSEIAAVAALAGDFTPKGRLPVTVPGLAERGAGAR